MAEQAVPAIWIVVLTGAFSGLLSSLIGYAVLGLPLVKVRVIHDLSFDTNGKAAVNSYVKVANVRGRPVKIQRVAILQRRGMSHPRAWAFNQLLSEGDAVMYTFNRGVYPNAVAVAIDTAGRVWPRRRALRVRRRILRTLGLRAWFSRNGPTDRQIAKVKRRYFPRP